MDHDTFFQIPRLHDLVKEKQMTVFSLNESWTLAWKKKASRVGLKANINTTKVFSLAGRRTPHIYINGQSIEDVNQFLYLTNVISIDGVTEPTH